MDRRRSKFARPTQKPTSSEPGPLSIFTRIRHQVSSVGRESVNPLDSVWFTKKWAGRIQGLVAMLGLL